MSSFGGTTTANGPSSTTEQAKEKAQEGAQQAKRTVRDQVDQRSTEAGERVRYSCGPEGADYIAICLPAFGPDLVGRED